MVNGDTISRPYAKAIFEFSVESNQIDYWEKKLFFFSKVSESKIIKKILLSGYSYKYIIKVFSIACEKKLGKIEKKIIYLLAINKRLIYLKNIFSFFLKYKNQHNNIIKVDLISPFNLSNSNMNNISNFLKKKFSKNITLNLIVDISIIGGIIIKVDDLVIDNSLQTYLKQLKHILHA
ncbi:F0F1 ATP synthase subunit delta [Buchnera aphidicola (Mindarus keteleerifoliae)]|uniref:F0F1 ATP synthase subunit delta n=1 Tax=Buchnera aphidicola TaxID=9 RepID=UPI0031B6FB4F